MTQKYIVTLLVYSFLMACVLLLCHYKLLLERAKFREQQKISPVCTDLVISTIPAGKGVHLFGATVVANSKKDAYMVLEVCQPDGEDAGNVGR